jgi:hypothetical protein
MSATVTKSQLVESINEVYFPVLDRQVEEGTIADATDKDTVLVDLCRSLVHDVELMFSYTSDREKWSHVDDLTATDPFAWILSFDTESVSSMVHEWAEKYFHQSRIRTRELDWFYLDFSVALGCRVLLKSYADKDFRTAYPVVWKALDDYDGSNVWALVKYILIAAVKNIVVFGLVVFLFLVASDGHTWAGLLGGALVVWKLYGWYSQSRLYRKLNRISAEKVSQFNALYKLFSDGFVRWDLLEHDIKRLRDLSIEFPLVLDTAITATKKPP